MPDQRHKAVKEDACTQGSKDHGAGREEARIAGAPLLQAAEPREIHKTQDCVGSAGQGQAKTQPEDRFAPAGHDPAR